MRKAQRKIGTLDVQVSAQRNCMVATKKPQPNPDCISLSARPLPYTLTANYIAGSLLNPRLSAV